MNWLDIVIIVCVSFGAIHGLATGIVKQVLFLVSSIIAIFLSGTVAKLMSQWVQQHFQTINDHIPLNIQNAIYYVLAFILIICLLAIVVNLVDQVINYTPAEIFNRLFGALFGVFLWALCLSIALNFLAVFDSQSRIISKPVKEQSKGYEPVRILYPTIFPYIHDFFK